MPATVDGGRAEFSTVSEQPRKQETETYVSRERDGEHRGICDADVGQTVDLQVLIDDTALFKRQHGARARRVILGSNVLGEPGVPVLVRLDTRSRHDLVANDSAERSSGTDLARKLQALAEDDSVSSVREVLGINRGLGERIARGDVDPALGEGVLERRLNGDNVRGAAAAGEREKDLDLADGAREERVQRGVVDRLVALDDSGIRARHKAGRELTRNLVPEVGR